MERLYSTSNLFTFESVVDTDLGIINFMIKKYAKSKYFNMNMVNTTSENVKKNTLIARPGKNPIVSLLLFQYANSADDMLAEIEEKYMEEVLTHSKPNDLLKWIKTLQTTDGVISCVVSCKNELQKQYINDLDSTIPVVMNEVDMSGYDCLFLKYVEDIVHYKNLGGKYINLLNYMHNIDRKTGVPKKIILTVSGHNKVRIIDPYIGLTLALTKIGGIQ